MEFKSIFDFMKFFKDEQVCRDFLKQRRFKDGNAVCLYCGHDKVYEYKEQDLMKCSECKKRFSIRKGTIFDSSRVSLQKWFMAIYFINTSSKGISSVQLSEKLGVTQKTAWFMAHRIRLAYDKKGDILGGIVEVDETYVGGKEKNKHSDKKTKGTQGRNTLVKQAVIGGLQRGIFGTEKKVIAQHVKAVNVPNISKFVKSNVDDDCLLITDEFVAYRPVARQYTHRIVRHNKGQYVDGLITTNGIENFWSIFKRGYVGVYHYMSKKHLQRYMDEYTYRFNSKRSFDNIFSNINGILRYKELIRS